MPSKPKPPESRTPLTFDLPANLLKTLKQYQADSGAGSASVVVRHALERFDFRRFKAAKEEHKQVSVRLPVGLPPSWFQTMATGR